MPPHENLWGSGSGAQFLNSILDEVNGQPNTLAAPPPLPPPNNSATSTHQIGWVGPGARLDAVERKISCFSWESNHHLTQKYV
jgi:hypothetical protein